MKNKKIVLIALPQSGFDPTECVTPWMILKESGHEVKFTTPDGKVSQADTRMVTGGFGLLSCFLMTHPFILNKYKQLLQDENFKDPIAYDQINVQEFAGLIIPGGHGKEMSSLLNSKELQGQIVEFFNQNKIVGAICTGVLAIANSYNPKNQKSVLYGKKTTAVTKFMEDLGCLLTKFWLGNYFKIDSKSVQELISQSLKKKEDFIEGSFFLYPMRYTKKHLNRQFVVKDGNYLSARFPGDAYRFSQEFLKMIN